MHKLLEKLFETNTLTNSKKEVIKIHSETRKEQCEFLQKIIGENNYSKSIEIGFAYGVSTLAITEMIVSNNGKHTVIDKYQNTAWGGNGLDLISQAGYQNNLDFLEEFCYTALPKLLEQNRKFDFAYIDSTKQFDWLLVNFFYLDKLLQVGGTVIFDDVSFPGIRKLIRYISQFPNYKIYNAFPENYPLSTTRKIFSFLKYLPKSRKFIREDIIKSDFEMGINTTCIALMKIAEDTRNWDWHKEF